MKTIAIVNQKGGVGKTISIRNIFDHRPDSHGAEDYLALCKEIVEREGG